MLIQGQAGLRNLTQTVPHADPNARHDVACPPRAGADAACRRRACWSICRHAADGYVGVAQDLRLIFGMLCEPDSVEVSGLLMPTARHDLPHVRPGRPDAAGARRPRVLHWMERNWAGRSRARSRCPCCNTARCCARYRAHRHELLPLADRSQLNALWRILFARTLAPEQREHVLAQQYYATDLSVSAIIDRVRASARADAETARCARISMPCCSACRGRCGCRTACARSCASTMPFRSRMSIRCELENGHGAFAPGAGLRAGRDLRVQFAAKPRRSAQPGSAARKACRGHPVRAGAARGARRKAPIPPPIIGRHVHLPRRSGRTAQAPPPGWTPPAARAALCAWRSPRWSRARISRSLIRAWERVVGAARPRSAAGHRRRPRLAGGAGAERRLRPAWKRGQIFHLQNVPSDDLQTLMRHAACFAVVSYNEGFGYSPLEATQAGAPCVISDLPVFRWIFGDAALYVDPYDVESIATGIERLTSLPDSADLVRAFASRGRAGAGPVPAWGDCGGLGRLVAEP